MHIPRLAASTTPPFEPTWLDLANFWVSVLGTVASTVIAVFAIVLTIRSARSATRTMQRAARAAWVSDYHAWISTGHSHLMTFRPVRFGAGLPRADLSWAEKGNELSARAQVLDSPGANNYVLAIHAASIHIPTLPETQQLEAATAAINLMMFSATRWVDDPKHAPIDLVDWLNSWLSSPGGSSATDTDPR